MARIGDAKVACARRSNDGWIRARLFSLHSPINGNLGRYGAVGVWVELNCRGDVMRKFLVAVVAAATLAGAAVATSGPAEARWGGGWGGGGWRGGGWRGGGWGWGAGGFVAGALIGSALAAPYYYPYGPYYGSPYYGRPCIWRRWWNGYGWVHACV